MQATQSTDVPLNERAREILRRIIDGYLETGEPVGSRTLSRQRGITLSPATIRNVMADLEESGLLYAPHTSAGRMPTEAGLRLFVHGLLEIGGLGEEARKLVLGELEARRAELDELTRKVVEAGLAVPAGEGTAGVLIVRGQSN